MKIQKEQKSLADIHWQGVLADNDEEHKVEMRRAQEREYDLCQKIKYLEEEVTALRDIID